MKTTLSIRSLVALSLLLLSAGPVSAQTIGDLLRGSERTVSVTGEGEVRVEPDEATVRFGVVTQDENPEAARERNAEASSQAMNAVRELGIPEGHIRLEMLRLEPTYEYDEQRRTREIVGYEAIRMVVVELDDLEKLPTLVARVVQQGANRLEGIEYGLQERSQARNEALQEALRDARAKAELMAGTLDEQIGQVLRIEEQNIDFPRPVIQTSARAFDKAESAAAPEPDAYAAGEIEVTANVHVSFALR